MAQQYKFSIQATADTVETAINQISHYCISIGFNNDECFRIQVVLAEALNNIIEHALLGRHNEFIEIHYQSHKSMFIINIIDRGTPLLSPPNSELPTWEAESGRGWPIIYSWMDEVSHQHSNNKNQLILKKYLPTI